MPMPQPDHIFDSLLIVEYQAGNKKALSLLVKRWHATFCKHANWYLKDTAIAQDVVQECWIVIIKKMGSLKDSRKFAPWALTIVHRKAIDQFKKNQKVRNISNTDALENVPSNDSYGDTHESNKNERLLKIDKGIDQLPIKQRIVIELFYKNDLNLNQIAQVLDLSKGTVKSRLFYAREALKQQLKT